MFLFISTSEIFFIVFVVLMIFGADKIPEIARGLGKGMRQLRDATNDIKSEIRKSAEKSGIDTSVVEDIQNKINQVKEGLEDASGRVKRQR
ncbi:Sec-independent protein translocase subunit TatA/TatB [Capnocytophaga canimorsus]|uniref:Sec-independent protein translocase subunit TatA/TatB n=1 Tax=Capnocytophaga canimorsus TaxID=28188 RepID=UPI000F6B72C4|nr:twin-arginine translocase TatA/TatE family subunit [Capnocytophaga canimorsus]VEJ20096.1 twin arginine translocase protein A [Capnocytophaga canimorsus]